MLRQSFASLTRAALPTAARASQPRAATLASTQGGRRHYSEAASSPGSEGAEAASSAQPEQKVESVSEKGKGKEQKEASPADLAELTKKLEKAEDDARSFKVGQLEFPLQLCVGQRRTEAPCSMWLRSSQDSWRNTMAEFDNFQKRTEREKQQTKDLAIERFAKEIIDNVDILQLALNSVPADRRAAAASPTDGAPTEQPARDHLVELYEGVDLTSKNLLKTLSRFGVTSFDPTGQKFNPNRHEALYQAPIPGKEPGTVLDCSKQGWMLKDRVLRAAQVGVVMDTK